MTTQYVWPRLDRSKAEKKFTSVTLDSGPELDFDLNSFDYSGVGDRMSEKQLRELRDELIAIAEPFGFKHRHGYDQAVNLNNESSRNLDIAYMMKFRDLTPMRWAEAGSREVWSWFSLAFLPDITHWRWKSAVEAKQGERAGEWYKPRWIGSDLTRHTWSRYWWRSLQFQDDPKLLAQLREHDFNHLVERKNSIGSNIILLSSFGRLIVDLYDRYGDEQALKRADLIEEPARLLRQRMAYVDHSILDQDEIDGLVAEFAEEIKSRLDYKIAKSGQGQSMLWVQKQNEIK